MSSPRILLVTDAAPYLIWHLPRLFHKAGAEATLLSPREQPFRRSRFLHDWIEGDSRTSEMSGILKNHLVNNSYDLVVFTNQRLVEELAGNAECLPWLKPEIANAITCKTAFFSWAHMQSIRMPPGCICRSIDDACGWMEAHGPSIVKLDYRDGGAGVRYVATANELSDVLHELGDPSVFLMQKFIHGTVGVTEMVLRHGEIAAWFSSTKERTTRRFGPSIMRRPVNPDGMMDLVRKVADLTQFNGLCGFDWVQDEETGSIMLLEFHPRVPSGYGFGQHWGVDVSSALKDILHDSKISMRSPGDASSLRSAPCCCYFPNHLWYAISRRRRDLKYWIPWGNAVSWKNIPFDDPLPLFAVIFSLRNHLIRRINVSFRKSKANAQIPAPAE